MKTKEEIEQLSKEFYPLLTTDLICSPKLVRDGYVKGYNQCQEDMLTELTECLESFPDNVEIWKWWQTQKFQKEQGEQEYTMIYEIDLPKILKAFTEQFPNCV